MTMERKRYRSLIVLITAIGTLYTLVLISYLQPINTFWSMDQGVKLFQVFAFIRSKFISSAIEYPGNVLDPSGRFMPLHGQFLEHNGQIYGMFSDAFAALSAPLFFLFGYAGLYVLPVLASLGILVLCWFLACRMMEQRLALLAVAICGIATPVWFYSENFWEHTPATFLTLLALYLASRSCIARRSDAHSVLVLSIQRRPLVLAGILIGMAIWLRIELVLAIVALVCVFLVERRSWHTIQPGYVMTGAMLTTVPFMIYNQLVFGHLLGPHVMVHLLARQNLPTPSLTDHIVAYRDWINLLLVPDNQPLLVLSCIGLLAYYFGDHFLPRQLEIWGPLCFIIGCTIGLLLYSRGQFQTALVVTAPCALFGFLPAKTQRFSHEEVLTRFLMSFSLIFIGLCWIVKLPDGGAQWGPRMLLPAIPLLILVSIKDMVLFNFTVWPYATNASFRDSTLPAMSTTVDESAQSAGGYPKAVSQSVGASVIPLSCKGFCPLCFPRGKTR